MVIDNSELNSNTSARVIRGNPNTNYRLNRFQQSLSTSGFATSGFAASSGVLRNQRFPVLAPISGSPTDPTTPVNPGTPTNTTPTPVTPLDQLRADLDTDRDDVVSDFEALTGILAGKNATTSEFAQLNSKALVLNDLVKAVNTNGDKAISDIEVASALVALKDTNSILSRLEANTSIRKALVDYVLGKNPNYGRLAVDSSRVLSDNGVIDAILNNITNSTPLFQALNGNLIKLKEVIGIIDKDSNKTISDDEFQSAVTALKDSSSVLARWATDSGLGLNPINYILYKNPTVDIVDTNNDNRVTDQEVIDALMSANIESGALLDQISSKSSELIKLLKAIDLDANGTISNNEALNTLKGLHKPDSAIALLKTNTQIGQVLINYVLTKNTSTILADYISVDNDTQDGVLSSKEVFDKLRALASPFTATTVVPEPLNSILGANPNYSKIKNLVIANNFNTLNHANSGESEVTDVVRFNNAKAVFVALLNARQVGLDALIKDKILSSSNGGYADVDKIYAMVVALDPDANGAVEASNYIQAYQTMKNIDDLPSYMSTMVSKLVIPGRTVYDFSNAKDLLDKITDSDGLIDYTTVGDKLRDIKTSSVTAASAAETSLFANLARALILDDIPSSGFVNDFATFVDGTSLTADQKANFKNRIGLAQNLTEALTVMDSIDDTVPKTVSTSAMIDGFKTRLRNEFALVTAMDSISLNPGMPLSESVNLSIALLNTQATNTNHQAIIDKVRSSYVPAANSNRTLSMIDGVVNQVNEMFKGKIVDSTTLDTLIRSYNNIIHDSNGTNINPDKLVIASQALRRINLDAFNAISTSPQTISDAEVFDQLMSIINANGTALTNSTVIPDALRAILAANPNFTKIKSFLINNNLTTLNRVNSGTSVTDAVRLDNAKAVFRTLLNLQSSGLNDTATAYIISKIPSSNNGGHSDVSKINELVKALDPDKNGVVNPGDYPQAYVRVKALANSETYLSSLLTRFDTSSTSSLYDFSATKVILDRLTKSDGSIDFTSLGNELKNLKSSTNTASVADKASLMSTIKSLSLTAVPSANTSASINTLVNDSSLGFSSTQKASIISRIENSQILSESLRIVDEIAAAGAGATAIASLKANLKNDFALVTAMNTLQSSAGMTLNEYVDFELSLQDTQVSDNYNIAINLIKSSYTAANPSLAVAQGVTSDIYNAFNAKTVTITNIDDFANIYDNITKGSPGTVADRIAVALPVLRKINPDALSLITMKQILSMNDIDGDKQVDNVDIAKALFNSRRTGSLESGYVANINAIINAKSASDKQAIIALVDKIDPDKNGVISNGELIRDYMNSRRNGYFTGDENAMVLDVLKSNSNFTSYTTVLNKLKLDIYTEVFLDSEIIASSLTARKKNRITDAELNPLLISLGTATVAANGTLTASANLTRIQTAVDSLTAYTGANFISGAVNTPPPVAIDANGDVTLAFVRYYLKEQALRWTSGNTGLPDYMKNGAHADEVVSVLKSSPTYQRTKYLMSRFVDVTTTGNTSTYNFSRKSLINILVQKNLGGADSSLKLIDEEYQFYRSLIPDSAFTTSVTGMTAAQKTAAYNSEIAVLEKAVQFLNPDKDNVIPRTRVEVDSLYLSYAAIAADNSNAAAKADALAKVDFNNDGVVDAKDRAILDEIRAKLTYIG